MGSSLYLNENYTRKCFWTQEKETRVNFNTGLNAPDVYMNYYTMTWMLHILLLICYTALKIQLMFCGNFHTNICQLLNTKFNLLIYLHLPWKCAFGTQSRVCWCQLLLSEILTQKWLDVNLNNYSIILAQMWPNLARTGLQKYAACRQWSLSCHSSAKMIA